MCERTFTILFDIGIAAGERVRVGVGHVQWAGSGREREERGEEGGKEMKRGFESRPTEAKSGFSTQERKRGVSDEVIVSFK